jgi:O-antigen ligase
VGLAGSISIAELALAVILAAQLLDPPRGSWRLPLGWPVVAFVAWTTVTALASARPLESLWEAKTTLWLLTIVVVANALPDRAAASRWTRLLFICVVAVAVVAIVQSALCPVVPPDVPVLEHFLRKCARARGFFSIYMTLAGVVTVVLVTMLPGVVRAVTAARPWAAAAWLVGLVALALTYVRSAWLGFALGAASSLVLMKRRWLPVAALALVLVAATALPGVGERMRTIGSTTDETTRDRLAMLAAGVRIAADHPWTGVGPGQVKHLYARYATPEALRRSTSHLHNTPLQILVERGVVGLVLWLALFGAFFVRATRILRRLPPEALADRAIVSGVVGAVVAFLLAGLFEYNFGDTEVLMVACAVMALPFVVEADRPGRSA